MDGHKEWIKRGFDDGVFVLVGSLQPSLGGGIVAHNTSLRGSQAPGECGSVCRRGCRQRGDPRDRAVASRRAAEIHARVSERLTAGVLFRPPDIVQLHPHTPPSPAGLTRGSIRCRDRDASYELRMLLRLMDRRVIGERSDAVLRTAMPGDDGGGCGMQCANSSAREAPAHNDSVFVATDSAITKSTRAASLRPALQSRVNQLNSNSAERRSPARGPWDTGSPTPCCRGCRR